MKNTSIKGYRRQQVIYGYLFCLLAIITFILFKYIPITNTFFLSLFHYTPGEQEFIGFDNFNRLLTDSIFWQALSNTTFLVLTVTIIGTVLGYTLALMFRGGITGGKFFRVLFFLPVITTVTVIALVFRILYNPIGIGFSFNAILGLFGIPAQPFLTKPETALFSVAIPLIWKTAAYNMIIFIAALDGVDIQQIEAAKLEGAGYFQQLRYVLIPNTRFSITLIVILAVLRTYRVFTPIYVMTFGDPNHATESITTWIYKLSFRHWEMGYGSSLAVILFLIIFILTIIQLRVNKGETD